MVFVELLLDVVPESELPLVDTVPEPDAVPEAEPESEPDALTDESPALTVAEPDVVWSLGADWVALDELELLVDAPAEDVSLDDVLVFVSTEQPARPRASSAVSITS